jgi:hypothetical protein
LSGVPSAFVVGAVQLNVRDAASTRAVKAATPVRTSITMSEHDLAIDAIRARVPDVMSLAMGRRLLVMQTLLGFTSEGRSGKEGATANTLQSHEKSASAPAGSDDATSER